MTCEMAVFDLDGTLFDTLPDLHRALNHALAEQGWPKKELSDTKKNIGNGIYRLICLSAPENACKEDTDRCFRDFLEYYSAHLVVDTVPYPGIPDLLRALREHGITIAVASNKYDAGAKEIVTKYFGNLVAATLGDTPEFPRKPDRNIIDRIFEITGADPKKTVYIGDSEVDLKTAANAGLPFIAVSWGYRDETLLTELGAERVAHTAEELYDYIVSGS